MLDGESVLNNKRLTEQCQQLPKYGFLWNGLGQKYEDETKVRKKVQYQILFCQLICRKILFGMKIYPFS